MDSEKGRQDHGVSVKWGNFVPIFALIFLLVLLTGYYIWGIQRVPFHPDESTYLFMSADFETWFEDPLSMAYSAHQQSDRKQIYRELDAPLTRYILGKARWLLGLPALETDWDWTKTWVENQNAGALPDEELLFIARLAITLLLPLSLFFLYQIGFRLSGIICGLLAVLFYGTHTLVLLHNRRAMAEGALSFGVIFALWSFLRANKFPWLAGIATAIAFNAKQSTLAMFPIGLIAVSWLPTYTPNRNRKILYGWLQYLAVFVVLTFLLNPLYWRQPLTALRASWDARQRLLTQQVADVSRLAPDHVLETPSERLAVLIGNLYFSKPAFAEAQNYHAQTSATEQVYLATPGHLLFRNLIGAAVMLALTLFGLASVGLHVRQVSKNQKRALVMILAATLLQFLILIALIPLAWQRYIMPLVPYVCLWSAYGIGSIIDHKLIQDK